MRDVRKKMADKMAQTLFRFSIFLPAMRTISFFNNGPTVQTGLIVTEMMTTHSFFLKIVKKIYALP